MMIKKGFDANLADYLNNIQSNNSLSDNQKSTITKFSNENEELFNIMCGSIFNTIQADVTPCPLATLIDQALKGATGFKQDYNKPISNLIKLYWDNGVIFTINVASILGGSISDKDEENAVLLKQEIYEANIKIIDENIRKYLIFIPEIHEIIQQMISTTLLPKSLKEYISLTMKPYDEIQTNPILGPLINSQFDEIEEIGVAD